MATFDREQATVRAVERAAGVLRILAGSQGRLGVVELGRSLGVSKGTIHGIVRALQRSGLVEQDPTSGKYQLGPAALAMGIRYLDTSRLRAAVLEPARALASASAESVRAATLLGRQALIVHHLPAASDGRAGLDVGRLVPAHATALGKVMLSQDPVLLAELKTAELERFTPATITDPIRLRQAVAEAQEHGWAAEIDELRAGVASVAAPIAAARPEDAGALAVVGPTERLCPDGIARPELIAAVLESARAGSRALGGGP